MKPRLRKIIEDCIENGVRRGYNRAHKHVENPGADDIITNIENAVMAEFYDYFIFESEDF